VRLNLAMALLRRGDIGEGLPFYEARIEKPTWDGFATRDSRIAAHARLLRRGDDPQQQDPNRRGQHGGDRPR
jgi:hypothetical protein